jgi:flagellar motor component MotA
MYFIALILLVLALVITTAFGQPLESIFNVLDLPSLFIVLIITIPMLLASGLFPDLKRAFKAITVKKVYFTKLELQKALEAVRLTVKLITFSGIFGFLIGLINILKHLSEPKYLGPNLSVALICLLYSIFAGFIFMPISAKLKVMLFSLDEEK